MIARWGAALADSPSMATISTGNMLAANQRKSLAVQRPSGLVGGEYMAASCSEYLELQNIWDYAAMFATRRVIRNTSASGTWQTSMPALSRDISLLASVVALGSVLRH